MIRSVALVVTVAVLAELTVPELAAAAALAAVVPAASS